MAVLLDASAFLALLLEEPGADAVARALDRSVISAVTLAEVIAIAVRSGHPPARAAAWANELGLPVLAFDGAMAAAAAGLLAAHRGVLSLGDCACLGTAQVGRHSVLTADRAWTGIECGVDVTLVR